MPLRIFISIFFICAFCLNSTAQTDTIPLDPELQRRHSPHKATIMSLVLPGLGQVYNKKYWKVPIIYAGLAGSLYFAFQEKEQFSNLKKAYIKRVDNDPNTMDTKYQNYSDENMLSLIDFHRRNRDLLFVASGIVYALNVVDAAVDAHLYYFDLSDDLTASIRPNVEFDSYALNFAPGLKISLKFGNNPLKKPYHH